MLELEWSLVERFGWSLHEIDQTDIGSLIPFVLYTSRRKAGGGAAGSYCDEVSWL
jgi:hypothetical protein